jgi:hypothetical protein
MASRTLKQSLIYYMERDQVGTKHAYFHREKPHGLKVVRSLPNLWLGTQEGTLLLLFGH